MKHTPSPTAFVLLCVAVVVVPCLFSTRVAEVFAVPKLVALWVALALSLWILGIGVLRGRSEIGSLVWVPRVDAALIAVVVLNALAFAFSTDRHQSLFGERFQHQGVATLVLYLSFFVLARWLVADVAALTVILGCIGAGGVAVATYGLLQRTDLDPIWHGSIENGRIFSTIGQSNALAGYLVLVLAVTIPLAFVSRRAVRIPLVGAIALIVVALALTSSRGGEIAFAAVALVLGAFGWREARHNPLRRTRMVLVIGALGLVTLLGARPLASDVWDRATSSTELTDDVSIRDHLYFWQVAVQIARDHPLLGTGQETYPDQFPSYSQRVLAADDAARLNVYRVESPHNVFLTMAASTGLPALVAYVFALAGIAITVVGFARRAANPRHAALFVGITAALVGHIVSDLFRTEDLTEAWLFWVVVGAAVGVASRSSGEGSPEMAIADPADRMGG